MPYYEDLKKEEKVRENGNRQKGGKKVTCMLAPGVKCGWHEKDISAENPINKEVFCNCGAGSGRPEQVTLTTALNCLNTKRQELHGAPPKPSG